MLRLSLRSTVDFAQLGHLPKHGVTEMVRRLNFPREVEDLVGRYL